MHCVSQQVGILGLVETMIKIDFQQYNIIELMGDFGESHPNQKLLCATFEEVLSNCVHLPPDVM